MHRLVLFTVVFLEAIICLPQQAISQGHTFRVFTENGVTIAETTGGPKYSGELFTYEKEMVIDTGQSEETLLYRPRQFVADADGNFYIYDSGIGSILMFNADGRYLRSIGNKGQGPGEFRGGQIQMVREGIIQFFDTSLRRTTRFNIDGTLLDITTLPVGAGILSVDGFMILENDVQLVLTGDSDMANMGETQRRGAVTLSADGDTLGIVSTPWIQIMKKISMNIQGRTISGPTPMAYGPYPTSIFHPAHGTVLSSSILPELRLYNIIGRHDRTIRIVMEAEPVTQSDRSKTRQAQLSRIDQVDESLREIMEAQAERMPFAEYKAFWSLVEIDSEGYFWLDTGLLPALMVSDIHTYRILSPDGEYLGDTTRAYMQGSSISQGRLLILEEDPDTGEFIPTIYRIRPVVDGLKYP